MSSPPRQQRYALILAAGKSTRFKSQKSKVLHHISGKPLIQHVLDKLESLGIQKTFVVIGPQDHEVQNTLKGHNSQFVVQEERLGTGHAVMVAADQLRQLKGHILVLYADTPLIRRETLESLFETCEKKSADQVLLTAELDDPHGYGRIIRGPEGKVIDIIEEREINVEQKSIREINAGFNCFKISSLLEALSFLSRENAAQEYYLTDVLRMLQQGGKMVEDISTTFVEEILGINNRIDLSRAESWLRSQIVRKWLLEGVTIIDPSSVYIDDTVTLSPDTTIFPGVFLEGKTQVGTNCVIHRFCHLKDTVLEEGVHLDQCSVIRNSSVGKNTHIGPFAHLRNNVFVGSDCRIGNFVELKNCEIGNESKAAHLSYLGDAEIGNRVNIGAGTITCNYDGVKKHKTTLENGAFIGSNTQLVAPVTVKKGAYVAAGSSITEDVPAYALGIARGKQVNKKKWAKKNQKKSEKK